MAAPLASFKAARIFNPTRVIEMKLSVSDIDSLVAFPFLTLELKEEFPKYLAAV